MQNSDKKISLLLFKNRNLLQQNEKIGIFKRFFRAENIFLEPNQSILTDIWTEKINTNIIQKQDENLALFQTENLIINTKNPCILIGNQENDCWITQTAIDKSFFKNLKIIPLFQTEQKKNINEKATKFFRKYYQTHWQNQTKLLQKSWNVFFNTDEWENLKIKENLAFALKEWIFWIENKENYISIQKNLFSPTLESEKIFDKFKRKFEETQRKFEKLKHTECKDEESQEMLIFYFEKAQESLNTLENFWESEEKIYDTEITQEDIFYYVIAFLFKTKKDSSPIDFLDNFEIILLPDFFEYVEKGKQITNYCSNFQNIPLSNTLKVKNIVRTNEFIKRTILFLENENKIILDDIIEITEVPDFFWKMNIGKKTLAQRIKKDNDETEILAEKIQKYISFFE